MCSKHDKSSIHKDEDHPHLSCTLAIHLCLHTSTASRHQVRAAGLASSTAPGFILQPEITCYCHRSLRRSNLIDSACWTQQELGRLEVSCQRTGDAAGFRL